MELSRLYVSAFMRGFAFGSGVIFADKYLRMTTDANKLDAVEDDPQWITVHPNGKGVNSKGEDIKGRHILIESESGEVLAGAGGKFTGHHISQMTNKGNELPEGQHMEFVRAKQKNPNLIRENQIKTKRRIEQEKPKDIDPSLNKSSNETLRRLENNPIPRNFKSNADVSSWLHEIAPNVKFGGFERMSLDYASGCARAVNTMLQTFPSLGNFMFAIRHTEDIRYNYPKDLQEFEQKVQNKAAERLKRMDIPGSANLLREAIKDLLKEDANINIESSFKKLLGKRIREDFFKMIKERNISTDISASELLKEHNVSTLISITDTMCHSIAFVDARESLFKEEPFFKRMQKNVYADYWPGKNTVRLGENYYNHSDHFNKRFEQDMQSGFHPSIKPNVNAAEAILVHELTHGLDNALSQEPFEYLSKYDSFINKKFRAAKKAARLKGTDNAYMFKDKQEFVAECITEALCSKTPSKEALEILDYYKQMHQNINHA